MLLSCLYLTHSPQKLFCSSSPAGLIFNPPQPIIGAAEDGRAPRAPQGLVAVGAELPPVSAPPEGCLGVPRQGDGVTAPQGLAVDLALLRRKKDSLREKNALCICGLSP